MNNNKTWQFYCSEHVKCVLISPIPLLLYNEISISHCELKNWTFSKDYLKILQFYFENVRRAQSNYQKKDSMI